MGYTYGSESNCTLHNGTTNSKYKCRLGYQVNSQSIANNTSNVTLRLQVKSTDSSYATYGYKQTTKIDGTTLSAKSFDMRDTNTCKTFGERTITISHNADGTCSKSKSGSFSTTATSTYSLKSGSASVTVNPSTIPRYVTITSFYTQSTGLNSAVIYWSTDSARSSTYYSLDGGSSWIGSSTYGESVSGDSKSGTFNVGNLNPNTTYNIKIKIQRTDSGLWKESGTISFTTKDIARITDARDINFGDSIILKKTNPSGNHNDVRIELLNPTRTIVTRTQTSDDMTIELTDEEWDTFYKNLGNNNSITIRYVVDTIGNSTYYNYIDKTLTLTGNQKTAKINISDTWKRGKYYINVNGTWKRGIQWVNVNGTWKRSI